MNHLRDIEQEVERTLQLADSLDKKKADPYFYTRLKARMDHAVAPPSWWGALFGKPQVKLASLGLIVVVNAITIYNTFHPSMGSEDSRSEQIETLISDYQLNIETYTY